MPFKTVKVVDLKLRDVVRFKDSQNSFSTMMVTQISDTSVRLIRPYGITSDFSYTGGVIPYFGFETIDIWKDSTHMVFDLLDEYPVK